MNRTDSTPEGTYAPRSRLILTYALCGFANLGSLGIMIGGLGAMAPERRGCMRRSSRSRPSGRNPSGTESRSEHWERAARKER